MQISHTCSSSFNRPAPSLVRFGHKNDTMFEGQYVTRQSKQWAPVFGSRIFDHGFLRSQRGPADICSTAQASAGLEVEVLECKGVDGLEEQDEADEHKHRVADEIMLIAVLHLCACSSHKFKAHDVIRRQHYTGVGRAEPLTLWIPQTTSGDKRDAQFRVLLRVSRPDLLTLGRRRICTTSERHGRGFCTFSHGFYDIVCRLWAPIVLALVSNLVRAKEFCALK